MYPICKFNQIHQIVGTAAVLTGVKGEVLHDTIDVFLEQQMGTKTKHSKTFCTLAPRTKCVMCNLLIIFHNRFKYKSTVKGKDVVPSKPLNATQLLDTTTGPYRFSKVWLAAVIYTLNPLQGFLRSNASFQSSGRFPGS